MATRAASPVALPLESEISRISLSEGGDIKGGGIFWELPTGFPPLFPWVLHGVSTNRRMRVFLS